MEQVSIPVFPMLRPRGGKYVFDADELAILRKDILTCRELGCPGIATGVQATNGTLDADAMKRIVEWAYPMAVTCHKVFDVTPHAFDSLDVLMQAGCARVLTSGQRATAMEGAALTAQLVAHAAGRIIVMPGGSVRSGNIAQLAGLTNAVEFHSSGITTKNEINFSDPAEVRQMVEALANL
jgi:copper homeostasis protein